MISVRKSRNWCPACQGYVPASHQHDTSLPVIFLALAQPQPSATEPQAQGDSAMKKSSKKPTAVKPLVTEGYDKAAAYAKTPAKFEPKPEKLFALRADVKLAEFTARPGFLSQLLEWSDKQKEAFAVSNVIAEFNGRQIEGHKVTPDRCRRYVSYCLSHDLFKKSGTREAK